MESNTVKFNSCHDCKNNASKCLFYMERPGDVRKRQEMCGWSICPAYIKKEVEAMKEIGEAIKEIKERDEK